MEHFAFPGNIDFAADDQGAFHVLFMKGCCVYSSSVKQCLPSVNHEQFPIQMTQNCKHSKCLQILAEKDFPLKLLGRTPIKNYRRADWKRQPRSREHRFSTAKVTSSTQRPQTCTEAATKYYNYIVNETEGTPTADAYKSGGAKVQVTGHRSGHRPQATGQRSGYRPQVTGHRSGHRSHKKQ